MSGESDRAAALVAAAMAERALEDAIASRFVALSKDSHESLFGSAMGPCSSFNSKINLGYAMGIYGKEFKNALHVIREIRNAFAHDIKPIAFAEDRIKMECNKLVPLLDIVIGRKIRLASANAEYLVCCIMFQTLLQIYVRYHETTVPEPRYP